MAVIELSAKVHQLCIGEKSEGAAKQIVEEFCFTLEGIPGDRHAGFTRKADSRDTLLKRGTPTRNWRQWSAVSVEELAVIADRLEIPAIEGAWLGANITFSGIESFTFLSKGTRIIFPSGATITIEEENEPCVGPGRELERIYPDLDARLFVKAAMHLRGVVGVVHCSGLVRTNDVARVLVYDQNLDERRQRLAVSSQTRRSGRRV